MTLLIIAFCIVLLVLLITWGKTNAFLAFLIVSLLAGWLLGIPVTKLAGAVEKGMGDTLGSLTAVIMMGAMLGKLVAESGAAQQIASSLMKTFGVKYIQWALMVTGFVIGIPLFYNVGFVLMVPLIFSVAYQYKLPAVYIGLPMLASLSVTHGYLPPHPAPAALVKQFNANMGLTLLYGLAVAIPAIIIAGPIFAKTLKKIVAKPLQTFQQELIPEEKLPGLGNSLFSSLLPVVLLIATTILPLVIPQSDAIKDASGFVGNSMIVMLIAVVTATFTLGRSTGMSMKRIMQVYESAVKDVAMILLIIAGAGAFKEVLTVSGVSTEIAKALESWPLHPLLLAWLIACVIRVCIGSATVAGLTTAGIVAPMVAQGNVDPNLMVLSIGAGSLMFSHVNDGGFWLFKEYFNLSVKDTLRSWSLMETIVAIVGLAGVMLLSLVV
ncbi:gluconate transporter [Terrimonas sp.]|uniref:gluconate:H+ symporter n=1 Tax=Terrimonas sp. TaxID=1914338 RepID=UPI000D51954F|nr:gluconate:H+ symporter [Terrimonas sp.]PVD49983.1 gluconate transporter [Terrimonas sp.]